MSKPQIGRGTVERTLNGAVSTLPLGTPGPSLPLHVPGAGADGEEH